MSVKKKDRHLARKAPLQKSRVLLDQVLVLTRPSYINECGKQVPGGILYRNQAYDAYGRDLLLGAKRVHYNCYEASKIYVKSQESYDKTAKYFNDAINACRHMLADLDFCLFHYGTSQRKIKSIKHLIYLTKDTLDTIAVRLDRNKAFIS